jgi:hypothetical protein
VIAAPVIAMATWENSHVDVSKLLPAAVLVASVFGLDLLGKFSNAVGVLYVVPLLMVGLRAARHQPQVVAAASLCSVLTVIGFALAPDTPAAVGVAVVNRALSLLAIWLAASLCLLHLRVEDSLGSMREFLPICASCKKIRDEEGRWNHLESYFSEQFAVKFTHGICSDCVRQLSPEVEKKHLRYADPSRHPAAPKPAPGSLAG